MRNKHPYMILLILFSCVFLCLGTSFAAGSGNSAPLSKTIIDDIHAQGFGQRINNSSNKEHFRTYLQQKLSGMGYAVTAQQFSCVTDAATPSVISTGINYMVTKPGISPKTVVVGAHYDSGLTFDINPIATEGIDDNGSGVAALLEAAQWAQAVTLPYTVTFVLFDQEETGKHGSTYYVAQLTQAEKDNIAFMVNIDSIAAGDYCYIYGGKQSAAGTIVQAEVAYRAKALADANRLPIRFHPQSDLRPTPTIGEIGDNAAFMNADIPYLYMESTNWDLGAGGIIQTSAAAANDTGGTIMHTAHDDHNFLTATFGNRIYENMANHVALLKLVLKNASTMNLPIAVGNGETVSIPKTGDHSPIGIWVAVFITSSFGMYVSWNRNRRKQ